MQEKDKTFSFLYSSLYSFARSEVYIFPHCHCAALTSTVHTRASLLGQPPAYKAHSFLHNQIPLTNFGKGYLLFFDWTGKLTAVGT